MLTSAALLEPFRVTDGSKFRLKHVDPDDTLGLESDVKDEAQELLATGIERLRDLQEKLYAQDRWAVLLIFQAMDAAGKDSTIKHVMSGVNPQGVEVHAFKQPSPEELDHDYLWRCVGRVPERGRIGIFNRSHYEEVLVVRVHPELLVARLLEGMHLAAHRIDPRHHMLDRAVLAGRVHALEDDQHRPAVLGVELLLHDPQTLDVVAKHRLGVVLVDVEALGIGGIVILQAEMLGIIDAKTFCNFGGLHGDLEGANGE